MHKLLQIHFGTTWPEIWKDTKSKVNVLVASIGTGGTIAGRYLKKMNKNIIECLMIKISFCCSESLQIFNSVVLAQTVLFALFTF